MTSFQPATESQSGHIGARQTRVEDAALLRGLGCYADDAAIPPGTLHAAIIRSPTLMRGSLRWTFPKRC